jgi:2-aminoadipate transaminase
MIPAGHEGENNEVLGARPSAGVFLESNADYMNSTTQTNWPHRFAVRTALMKRSALRELIKLTTQPDMISFAGGLPAPDLLPAAEIREAADTVLRQRGAEALQYGRTEGLAELRDWIAGRFARSGLPVTAANVVIFNGAQQALDLIGRIFLDPGDTVIVENPTYLALLSAWRPLGVEFLPAPCDDGGIRVEELAPLLSRRPKLLYTIPTFQNPSGTTLAHERRSRLVELARDHGVGIIEDDPYHELRYDGASLPHLIQLDAESNVIHVGTFSKILAPGLRLGWTVAPEDVVDKLIQAKQAADLHTGTLTQHIAWELVRNGFLDRQIPLLRRAYRERRDAMLAALEQHFPDTATWTRPDGGMFLMVTLASHLDAAEFLRLAIPRKVAFVPGADFHLDGVGGNTLRLNFSNTAPARIEEGIRRLGELLGKPFPSNDAGHRTT